MHGIRRQLLPLSFFRQVDDSQLNCSELTLAQQIPSFCLKKSSLLRVPELLRSYKKCQISTIFSTKHYQIPVVLNTVSFSHSSQGVRTVNSAWQKMRTTVSCAHALNYESNGAHVEIKARDCKNV